MRIFNALSLAFREYLWNYGREWDGPGRQYTLADMLYNARWIYRQTR